MPKFVPPDVKTQLGAVGLVEKNGKHDLGLTELYRGKPPTTSTGDILHFLIPEPHLYHPVPKPKSDDWLACHKETGQTFKQFAQGPHNVPNRQQNTIIIQPLQFGEDKVSNEVKQALCKYASIFFDMNVEISKKKTPWTKSIPSRINEYSRKRQVHAGKILTQLASEVPREAFCVAALTLCDLYPDDDWNFVFGLASLQNRCGVYSLARYLSDEDLSADKSKQMATLLRRACLLMCHEICHMFGLKHCIYFHCLMNGSNHLAEFDRKPVFLCPVCLRKMHHSCLFKIQERYTKMLSFWQEFGCDGEIEWLHYRLHNS